MPNTRPSAPRGVIDRTSMSRDGAMTPNRKPVKPNAAINTTPGMAMYPTAITIAAESSMEIAAT